MRIEYHFLSQIDVASENGISGGRLLNAPDDDCTNIAAVDIKQLFVIVALSKLHSYNIWELTFDANVNAKIYKMNVYI
jgi:hypothetical protein